MSLNILTLLPLLLLATVYAQQVGTLIAETHPTLLIQSCTVSGCTTSQAKIVLDANLRRAHYTPNFNDCYHSDTNTWDLMYCQVPGPIGCANNCALDGVDYAGTYGITTSGNALRLNFVTPSTSGSNVGSRVILLADDNTYKIFRPLAREIAFDVDASKLPCGLDGAMSFVAMDADGGMSRYPTNKAGAKYGTGYCDSRCPRTLKWINGEANLNNWDSDTETGFYGSCCAEMGLWDANSVSAAFTAHPCSMSGQYRCQEGECSDPDYPGGPCDADGCDFNPYRMGNKTFYGPAKTINTNAKFTVVTQFITNDGTPTGTLVEIRRKYVQNGITYQNSIINIPGLQTFDSITDRFCLVQKVVLLDDDYFTALGGLTQLGEALRNGMALVFSIGDDWKRNMLWLDGVYPPDAQPSAPGVSRGTCGASSGYPPDLEAQVPNASVIFSNIKFGELGSTSPPPTTTTTSRTSTTTTSSRTSTTTSSRTSTTTRTTTTYPPGALQSRFAQCGGTGWTGPTGCVAPYICTYSNAFFSQCL